MTTFKKDYIGKGKRVEKAPNIVAFVFKLEDLKRIAFEHEGTEYVKIETSEKKEADKFGNTHSAWVSVKVTEATEEQK